MKPGPEMDRAVAEAMGWRIEQLLFPERLPRYSTTYDGFDEMLAWLRERGIVTIQIVGDECGVDLNSPLFDALLTATGLDIKHALAALVLKVAEEETKRG